MKNKYLRIVVLAVFLISFSSVIGAEPETPTWQQLFQVSIPNYNQFVMGGFLNSENGIAIGSAGVIRYTSDGGKTWQHSQNDSSNRYGLDIVNKKIAWNCGNFGNIEISPNAGASWQAVADYGDNMPNHCRFISFIDEITGWVASPTKLGNTIDSGIHWIDMKIPEGCGDLVAIFLQTSAVGYLLDMNGNLYTTQDGGATWAMKTIGITFKSHKMAPYVAMNFSDLQHGKIVIGIGGQTQILSTIDAGATWKTVIISTEIGGYIFLSRDGQYLTVSSMIDPILTVFQCK